MHHRIKPLLLAVLAACASVAKAESTPESMFRFSGFGTVGAVHSSEKNADFVSSFFFQPKGAGLTQAVSTSVDSRLGGQVTASFTKEISAVVQLVSEQQWDNSWTPVVEWANVKYAFTPDLSVRVGRVLLPTYMASESRKVGYTNPWIRPPVEVYNLMGITSNDGIDATYGFHVGSVKHTVSALAGKSKVMTSSGAEADLTPIYGISDMVEYGAFSARASYQTMKLQMPALTAYNAFGCSSCEVDLPVKIANIGATYDQGDWFVTSEWARIWLTKGSFEVAGVKTSAYVTAGYRFGKFTPYLGYSQVEQTVSPALGGDIAQKTVSAGLRWDFMKGTDFKLQFDRVSPGSGSTGYFINSNGTPIGSTSVISAAVDFVF